jgi:hypothetical protein
VRRAAVLLLVPAGVLVGHALAYAAAGHVHSTTGGVHPDVGHGYLSLAAAVAAPLALAGLFLSAVDGRVASVPLRRVCVLQWATFLLQEAVEHLLAGDALTAVVTSTPLWFGLVTQAAVALGATALLRAAGTTGVRLLALVSRPPMVAAAVGGYPAVPMATPRPRPRRTMAPRGPPLAAG